MDSGVINLGAERAERKRDNREWTVEDALEEMLCELRAGDIRPVHLVIHYLEPADVMDPEADPERLRHGCYLVHVNLFEQLGILDIAKRKLLEGAGS